MKVKELIEALSRLDGDKQVFVANEHTNWDDDVWVGEQTVSVLDVVSQRHIDHENVVVIF